MLYCFGVDNVECCAGEGGLFLGTDLSSSSVAIPALIWSPNIHPRDRDTKYYDKVKCWGSKLDMQEDRLMCCDSVTVILCPETCACYRLFHEKLIYIYISRIRYCSRCSDLLTSCSIVLLEKLTGFQLVKKFSAFCETRKFITAVTSAHHLTLTWASWIHSIIHIPLPEDPS